ncbi:hypothetical protein BpHYR1_045665 [Brachionus plicatilis]|uniref:Uncharacterized protein n=1 Tax=Brachionus plicatilis TaxID=10195 RepID=A0A3M7PDH7_BRAPC|nr:hypothetical protein BpHYR1_045665 [Brachionus plicatilis]
MNVSEIHNQRTYLQGTGPRDCCRHSCISAFVARSVALFRSLTKFEFKQYLNDSTIPSFSNKKIFLDLINPLKTILMQAKQTLKYTSELIELEEKFEKFPKDKVSKYCGARWILANQSIVI